MGLFSCYSQEDSMRSLVARIQLTGGNARTAAGPCCLTSSQLEGCYTETLRLGGAKKKEKRDKLENAQLQVQLCASLQLT